MLAKSKGLLTNTNGPSVLELRLQLVWQRYQRRVRAVRNKWVCL